MNYSSLVIVLSLTLQSLPTFSMNRDQMAVQTPTHGTDSPKTRTYFDCDDEALPPRDCCAMASLAKKIAINGPQTFAYCSAEYGYTAYLNVLDSLKNLCNQNSTNQKTKSE